jgi:hypothetical protein
VLQFPDGARVYSYVTDRGAGGIAELSPAGTKPHLTDEIMSLHDPIQIAQTLAPNAKIPDALRSGYAVPAALDGFSPDAQAWLRSHSVNPSDAMKKLTTLEQQPEGPQHLPVELGPIYPTSYPYGCWDANWFMNWASLGENHLCDVVLPQGPYPHRICNDSNVALAAENDSYNWNLARCTVQSNGWMCEYLPWQGTVSDPLGVQQQETIGWSNCSDVCGSVPVKVYYDGELCWQGIPDCQSPGFQGHWTDSSPAVYSDPMNYSAVYKQSGPCGANFWIYSINLDPGWAYKSYVYNMTNVCYWNSYGILDVGSGTGTVNWSASCY